MAKYVLDFAIMISKNVDQTVASVVDSVDGWKAKLEL
jgi:hypothetical protein